MFKTFNHSTILEILRLAWFVLQNPSGSIRYKGVKMHKIAQTKMSTLEISCFLVSWYLGSLITASLPFPSPYCARIIAKSRGATLGPPVGRCRARLP